MNKLEYSICFVFNNFFYLKIGIYLFYIHRGLSGINIVSTTSPSLIRKNNQFKTETVPAIFSMIAEVLI